MEFTNEQKKIITSDLGPVLVIAGPGSGKTATLIERILHYKNHFMMKGEEIWSITFTNKATSEIKNRLSLFDASFNTEWICTFHHSCSKIIRKYSSYFQSDQEKYWFRNSNFTTLNEYQKSLIIKQIILDSEFLKNEKVLKTCITQIKKWINHFQTKHNFWSHQWNKISKKQQEKLQEEYSIYEKHNIFTWFQFISIFKKYEEYCLKENALDFNQILLVCYIFLENENVLKRLQSSFKAILIDEFQDTNQIQLDILKKIAEKIEKQNFFCVGDPDQSIYSFRGIVDNIFEKFKNNFKNVMIYYLNQNFRSTKNIVELSNHLISSSSSKFQKNIFTLNEPGEKIEGKIFKNFFEEADWIVENIFQIQKQDKNFKLSDCLILYRNNYLSKNIEEKLNKTRIPYEIIGGTAFFNRTEIKFIVDFLNFLISKSSIALKNICNFPARGISESVVKELENYSNQQNILLWESFQQHEKLNLSSLKNNKILFFNKLVKDLSQKYLSDDGLKLKEYSSIDGLIDEIVEVSGYKKKIESEFETWRFENINFLKNSLSENYKKQKEPNLNKILEDCVYFSETEMSFENNDCVYLSSIFKAKGLEYKYVFLYGLSEGILPSRKEETDLEEEKRVVYVAITRAKKKLFISCNNQKLSWLSFSGPSIFFTILSSNNVMKLYWSKTCKN